jgi:TonB-linked SusC/RagA family outer membrane protein
MVTTKRGRKGELTLTFNSSVGWQQVPKKLSVLNLREFANHKNNLANFGIVVRDNSFVRADLLGDGTNWQDEIFTKAMIQNYNLSASGGSDKSTYSMSLGYLDQAGIALGSAFNRLNLSGSLDSQVKDYLKVGTTFALSNTAQKTTFSDDALILTALKQTPNVAVRNADGSFDGPATSEFVQTNPVALVLLKDNHNTRLGIRANTYLEIAFTKALKFKTQYSLDFNFGNDYKFDPSYTFGAINNTVRSGSRTASNTKFWNWENVLTYNKKLGKNNINAMLGQEMNKTTWESLYGYRTGYLTNSSTDLNAGDATTAKNSNSSGAKAMSSYFGRVFYSFDDKYLLTATLRRDGSSSFAPDKRWGWFPSAALAWKVSNENFLKNNKIINNLKLRLGWGLVGNQNAPLYAYTSVYATSATNWGTGLLARNTPNPDLVWEKSSSSNLGFDLSLLNNRVEIVADVYYKTTNDLILDLALPAYAGVTGQGSTAPPTYNIGSLENKGLEFTVNTKNIKGKDFSWNSNVVFSLNRNKVLKLNTETGVYNQTLQQGSDITTVTRTVAGQSIGQFYGYEVIGRFEKATDFYYKNAQGVVTPTALPTGMKIAENSVWIGDYIFKDQNNDGVIDEKDQTYIGNPAPKFTYGIGNTFTYKGFELNIFLNGSYGNDVINYQRRFLENPANGSTNVLTSVLGYAQLALIDPAGPNDYRNVQIVGGDPYMPRIAASSASSTSNFRYSDRIVEDGSYLRIKNISFGYNFPEKLVSKMRLSNLKLYTNLQNVYTFSKYKGYDPEVGSINQNTLLTGIDNGRYPTPFIYTFGLTANF